MLQRGGRVRCDYRMSRGTGAAFPGSARTEEKQKAAREAPARRALAGRALGRKDPQLPRLSAQNSSLSSIKSVHVWKL